MRARRDPNAAERRTHAHNLWAIPAVIFILVLSAALPGVASALPVAAAPAAAAPKVSQTLPQTSTPAGITPDAAPPIPPPAWNQVCATGAFTGRCIPQPPSSVSGQLVYDARDGYGLFFGGSFVNQSGFHAYTYKAQEAIGPEAYPYWTNITATAGTPPNAEDNGSLVYAPSYDGGAVLLIGGYNASNSFSTTVTPFYNGVWHTKTIFPGTGRAGMCAISIPSIGSTGAYILVFGGDTSLGLAHHPYALSDTWEFLESSGTWVNVTASVGTPPAARTLMGCAWDAAVTKGILFGGSNQASMLYNDTWEFNPELGSVGEWVEINTGSTYPNPPKLQDMGFSYDTALSGVILTNGGVGPVGAPVPSGATNTTWGFVSATTSWVNLTYKGSLIGGIPTGPTLDSWGTAFADMPTFGYALLFGGRGVSTETNSSFVFGQPPTVTIQHNLGEIYLGQTVIYYANASGGYGAGDEFSYQYAWVDLPSGCVANDAAVLSCTPNASGKYVFTRAVAYQDAIANVSLTAATLMVDPAASVSNSIANGSTDGVPTPSFFWETRLGGAGLTDGYGNGVGHTYNNLTGNTTLVNEFKATPFTWIRFGGGDDATNLTADCLYTSTGSCGPPIENVTAYLKFCQAVSCNAIWTIPAETDRVGDGIATLHYILNLEASLGFTPAHQMWSIGNEPNAYTHWDIPWTSWAATDNSTPTALEFAKEVQTFVPAIHAVLPGAVIIGDQAGGGVNTAHASSQTYWAHNVSAIDGPNVSLFAFHIYPAAAGAQNNIVTSQFLGQTGIALITTNIQEIRANITSGCPSCTNLLTSIGEINGGSGGPDYYANMQEGYADVPFYASQVVQSLALNLTQFGVFDFANNYPFTMILNGTQEPDYHLFANIFSNFTLGTISTPVLSPAWTVVAPPAQSIRGVYTIESTSSNAKYLLLVNTNTSVSDHVNLSAWASWAGGSEVWTDVPAGLSIASFPNGTDPFVGGVATLAPEGVLLIKMGDVIITTPPPPTQSGSGLVLLVFVGAFAAVLVYVVTRGKRSRRKGAWST
jgi:hypothetical protein